jgi:hypothetical protein
MGKYMVIKVMLCAGQCWLNILASVNIHGSTDDEVQACPGV